ncbi:helix-turn-helix transcriptional regulator [Xanthobacter sp. KR7-65]|uniref:helix-turn-helix transcriptional regulator n=1 Tax=Xanthobacter sp. KR7-65 TaxID=3156612 RepID=UPI0032B582BD
MRENDKSSHLQYFSIDWSSAKPTQASTGLQRHEHPTRGAVGQVDSEVSIIAASLMHMAVICANVRDAGTLGIVAAEEALIVAARASESSDVVWDGGAPRQFGAGTSLVGTLAGRVDIRLSPGEAIFVVVPRQEVALTGSDPAQSQFSGAGHPALDVLMAQAACLVGRSLPPPVAQVCETGLAGLLAVAIEGGDHEKARLDSRELLYREILLDIAANCRRHDFGVNQVAQRHKVNVRTLQKMFQKRGTTLKEHITATRLQLARGALLDPANAGKKVSDIAFEAGFNDIATFNRLFRKSFGRPPSALRTRAADPPEAQSA